MFKEGQKFILEACEEDGLAPVNSVWSGSMIFWATEYEGKNEFETICCESLEKGDLVLCEVEK